MERRVKIGATLGPSVAEPATLRELIAAGVDVGTVQRALGHARATTMLNTYAHLWSTAEDRTRQAAAELMRVTIVPQAG